MTIAYSVLGTAQFDNGAADTLTLTGTPSSGCDLYIFVAGVHYLEQTGNIVGSITASPAIGTISRITTAIDNGAGNLPKLEIFRAPAVSIGSAPTLTFNWNINDYSGHQSVVVLQVTGHSSNAPTVSAIAFSGASTNTFTSPSTGTLPSTGGLALQFLALRSNASTYTVNTLPSGFSSIQSLLSTSPDHAGALLIGKNSIAATTALAPAIILNQSPSTGGETATIYIEASGATATKTVHTIADANCVGKTGVMVEVFATDGTYSLGAKLAHYTGQAFGSLADSNGYATLDVVDSGISPSVGDPVLVVAKWAESGIDYAIGPCNGVIV